jgi:hypothetical protein
MNAKTIALNGCLALSALSLLLAGCRRDYGAGFYSPGDGSEHRASFTVGDNLTPPGQSWSPPAAPADGVDLQTYVDEQGHKIPKSYYIVYCDIFYKLDWVRSQLRKGIIPPEFGTKLKNVRKELNLATTGIARDGNYKVADEALTLLETGLQHYLAEGELAASGAQIRSAPWTVGRGAMQRYVDSGALGFGAKSIANTLPGPGSDAAPDRSSPDTQLELEVGGTSKTLTRRQQNAIEIALHYATDYQRSPHDCAQADWTKAAVKINTLGDQLYLLTTRANRDGGVAITVKPNSSSDVTAGIFDGAGGTARRSGADLPGAPAPTGDPFVSAAPGTQSPGRSTTGSQTP